MNQNDPDYTTLVFLAGFGAVGALGCDALMMEDQDYLSELRKQIAAKDVKPDAKRERSITFSRRGEKDASRAAKETASNKSTGSKMKESVKDGQGDLINVA